jgi:hypothetical protein
MTAEVVVYNQGMGQFGKSAVLATKCVTLERLPPRDAWDVAIKQLSKSPSVQTKTCPRNAYLGLCEAGAVVGIKAGKYGAPPDNPNGRYAREAHSILKSGPKQPLDEKALWFQAKDPDVKTYNQQMDVVLSLWKQALLH